MVDTETPEPTLPSGSKRTLEEGQAPNFDPAVIAKLPGMTMEQLTMLEDELSREFSSLAREYIQARRYRVDHLLSLTEKHIQSSQENEKKWTESYAKKVEAISRLATTTETRILDNNTASPTEDTLAEYEKELHNLLANLQLPAEVDDIFGDRQAQLPFSESFRKNLLPFCNELAALAAENRYQTQLIEDSLQREVLGIWKRYRRDAMEYRQELINKTYLDLSNLYKEYHGVNAQEMANQNSSKYYRSVVSVNDMRSKDEYGQKRSSSRNTDSYYDIDNPHVKRNKIELTATRRAVLDQIAEYEVHQQSQSIPQCETARVRLGGCAGLSQLEVNSDLAVLRSGVVERTEPRVVDLDKEHMLTESYKELLDSNRENSRLTMVHLEL